MSDRQAPVLTKPGSSVINPVSPSIFPSETPEEPSVASTISIVCSPPGYDSVAVRFSESSLAIRSQSLSRWCEREGRPGRRGFSPRRAPAASGSFEREP